jgi:type III secretion system FlhB-like substrate exporter
MGKLAERIIEKAVAAGVPFRVTPTWPPLWPNCRSANRFPPALYQAVAEVLAFIYR